MARPPRVARRWRRSFSQSAADQVLDPAPDTVLDLLDHILNKGVALGGDVSLGVAGVDLVYLQLSSLLCASDRVEARRRVGTRPINRPADRRRRR